MESFAILVTLDPKEWSGTIGGWRVEALRIPGATIVAVFDSGKELGKDDYKADGELLRYGNAAPHTAIAVKLTLPTATTTATKELLLTEQRDKNEAKHKTYQLWVTLGLGVLTFAGGVLTAYIAMRKPEAKQDVQAPVSYTHLTLPTSDLV